MEDSSNARVAAAIWPWRDRDANATEVETRARRRKSGLQAAIFLAVALILLFSVKHVIMGSIALLLSASVFLAGRFAPGVYDGMDRLVSVMAHLAGAILTWMLLVPCFALVLIPARAIIMLSGRDPLCRRFGSAEKTFWVSCSGKPPGDYGKQY